MGEPYASLLCANANKTHDSIINCILHVGHPHCTSRLENLKSWSVVEDRQNEEAQLCN